MQVEQNLTGIILCGGESKRMGMAKALLVYNELPQYLAAYHLLAPLCNQVFVSCKTSQSAWFSPNIPLCFDETAYENTGPMAALLSAIKICAGNAVLLLGCDYPALQQEDIQLLIQTYKSANKSCCYVSGSHKMEEPLLAIYHPDDLQKLVHFYQAGQQSLRLFLNQTGAIKVEAENPTHIKSFDTPEDFEKFKIRKT
ncbi:MAG: molybdenum cofactor guanylyltransferase [Bacteroidota bacterium]|nr:molybdenum cofactor guanylyltransferase [Bacteroidota bacterium]